MPQTVGSFVKEKLVNMGKWVAQETSEMDDLPGVFQGLSEIQVTVLAGHLAENKAIIIHEDWQALISKVSKLPTVPGLVLSAIQKVRANDSLHEKFWLYMQLFATVVNSNEVLE